MENSAMLGTAPELICDNTCNISKVVLKFKIKNEYINNDNNYSEYTNQLNGIKKYQVFKFYEDINTLLPVETSYDIENNTISCETDELGTYCLFDLSTWFNDLGYEVTSETQALRSVSSQFNTASIENEIKKYDFNGHTYGIYSGTEVLSWTDAKDVCEQMGGHLATVDSESKQKFIHELALSLGSNAKRSYWLGATRDIDGAENWHWVDGSEFEYTNWDDG